MTAAMSGTPEKVTSARFVARLTDAETTPGVARIAFFDPFHAGIAGHALDANAKGGGIFRIGDERGHRCFLYERFS